MGGMLELMMHCHYLFADADTTLAMPEVTLPVVPGMEGCHWAIRKAKPADRVKLMALLMNGKQVKAKETVGWFVDYAGSLENGLKKAWEVMQKGSKALPLRKVEEKAFKVAVKDARVPASSDPAVNAARKAIADCVEASCNAPLAKAIEIQAKHSAEFMVTPLCRKGRVGSEYDKVMQ